MKIVIETRGGVVVDVLSDVQEVPEIILFDWDDQEDDPYDYLDYETSTAGLKSVY